MQQNPNQQYMAQDISGDVAGLIGSAKTFGASENFRHGIYPKLLIKRVFAQMVEGGNGNHRMAFVEMEVLESLPNPQHEGDREGFTFTRQGETGFYTPGTGKLLDDGNNPNKVGSQVALKVDFEGAGGRSAGANIKAYILALFAKREGQISDDDVSSTWKDLARQKPLRKGDAIGINPQNNQPIFSQVDKPENPAAGMIIAMRTMPKKKKTANDKGAYITKLVWETYPGSPYGSGENAPAAVIKRREEMAARQGSDEDEEDTGTPPPQVGQGQQQVAPPPMPPVQPPPVPPAAWSPPAPWHKPAGHASFAPNVDPNQNFFWNGQPGSDSVKSEAQLRTMGL